jgi:hypothetical protein
MSRRSSLRTTRPVVVEENFFPTVRSPAIKRPTRKTKIKEIEKEEIVEIQSKPPIKNGKKSAVVDEIIEEKPKDKETLSSMLLPELRIICDKYGISKRLNKSLMIDAIINATAIKNNNNDGEEDIIVEKEVTISVASPSRLTQSKEIIQADEPDTEISPIKQNNEKEEQIEESELVMVESLSTTKVEIEQDQIQEVTIVKPNRDERFQTNNIITLIMIITFLYFLFSYVLLELLPNYLQSK